MYEELLKRLEIISSKIQNIFPNYKAKKVEGRWVVMPRECYVRRQLKELHLRICNPQQAQLQPYSGISYWDDDSLSDDDSQADSDTAFVKSFLVDPRKASFDIVDSLPIFCNADGLISMKNGHTRFLDTPVSERCWVVHQASCLPSWQHRLSHIRGAIHYHINVSKHKTYISSLGVAPSAQHKGFGSMLFQTALFTALLYGCKRIKLQSTEAGVPFYLKYGFQLDCVKSGVPEAEGTDKVFDSNFILDECGDIYFFHSLLDCPDSFQMLQDQFDKSGFDYNLNETLLVNRQKLSNFNRSLEHVLSNLETKWPQKKIYDMLLKHLDDLSEQVLLPAALIDEIKVKLQPIALQTMPEPLSLDNILDKRMGQEVEAKKRRTRR